MLSRVKIATSGWLTITPPLKTLIGEETPVVHNTKMS